MPGTLVLSYDFELAWASRNSDFYASDTGARHEKTYQTIGEILSVLTKYNIPSTWATVGGILLKDDWDFGAHPPPPLSYDWFTGDWYAIPTTTHPNHNRYYAPELVEQILNTPGQELGCHTFTHTYAAELATSRKAFNYEIAACVQAAKAWNIELKSFVYPRNMVGYIDILKQHRFTNYRSLNTEWYWLGHRFPTSSRYARGLQRIWPYFMSALRYADEALTIAPKPYPLHIDEFGLVELQHSAFLPGYTGVSKYVSANQRVNRIKKGMLAAAKNNTFLSIYFHPHNFNYRRSDCITFFAKICRDAAELREKGLINIMTMAQAAEYGPPHA